MHFTPQLRKRSVSAHQHLRCNTPQTHNYFRFDQLDLLPEVRQARVDFFLLRIAVTGRAALENVANVDLLALEVDRLENFVEQLPSAPDKRLTLRIFFCSGRFTNHHHICVGIANTKDKIRARKAQRTLRAVTDHRIQLIDARSLDPRLVRIHRRGRLRNFACFGFWLHDVTEEVPLDGHRLCRFLFFRFGGRHA